MEAQAKARGAPAFVGLFNPIASRLLKVGPLLGPNALITIRGRKSGTPRTTPIALIEQNGRRWVVGTFGETNWVRNLRAAKAGTLSVGTRKTAITATELGLAERTAFFAETLGPYARRLRIGPLLLAALGARDILDDPAAAAERRPVFELHAA